MNDTDTIVPFGGLDVQHPELETARIAVLPLCYEKAPSYGAGTGTPEPGGLSYRQLVSLIRALGREKQVVAADVNELAKIEGSQVSETMAARVAEKIIVYCSGEV